MKKLILLVFVIISNVFAGEAQEMFCADETLLYCINYYDKQCDAKNYCACGIVGELYYYEQERDSKLAKKYFKIMNNNININDSCKVELLDGRVAEVSHRFVITTNDSQVATARSDMASAMKAIVAKVFADNIDPTQPKAPDQNKSVREQNGVFPKTWGEWIMEVAELDSMRWRASDNGVYAIDNSKKKRKACYDFSGLPVLWIDTNNGTMVFNPSKLSDYDKRNGFCKRLRDSYVSENGNGDKVIPLNSNIIEF